MRLNTLVISVVEIHAGYAEENQAAEVAYEDQMYALVLFVSDRGDMKTFFLNCGYITKLNKAHFFTFFLYLVPKT